MGNASSRARRSGQFRLPLPAAKAFDYFTAEGERLWVDDWEPLVLSDCGATERGAVFLTDHGGEPTIWTVLEADRAAGRLAYSRVSPDRRAGIVTVSLKPAGVCCEVTVSYDMTALSPAGEQAVLDMSESGFAAMLGEWERLIRRAIAG